MTGVQTCALPISKEVEDYSISESKNKYSIEDGDLIIFDGKHKVLCGDSTNKNNFLELFRESKIDLLVTSPPNNLKISYGKYSDNKDLNEYLEMINKIFSNVKDFYSGGRLGRFMCVNIGREWGPINLPAKYDFIFNEIGYTFFRNIYWKKPLGSARGNPTRNPFPRYYTPKVQTEIIQIYALNPEKPELLDLMITYKFGETQRDKQEQIPKFLLSKYSGNVWEFNTEASLKKTHPAPYPIQLPFNCINFFSKENEIIFDPFIGSGTTLLASDQLDRICYGIELDPIYCGIIIDRYKKQNPKSRIEIKNGKKSRNI